MNVNSLGAGVFTIDGFLSAAECLQFIADSETLGYQEAAVRTDEGERLYEEARLLFPDQGSEERAARFTKPVAPDAVECPSPPGPARAAALGPSGATPAQAAHRP